MCICICMCTRLHASTTGTTSADKSVSTQLVPQEGRSRVSPNRMPIVSVLHPPLPLAGVSIAMKRTCQQNGSPADMNLTCPLSIQ